MFKKMSINITESDCREIFKTIDYDNSGEIQWAEFKHDFDKCKNKTLREL